MKDRIEEVMAMSDEELVTKLGEVCERTMAASFSNDRDRIKHVSIESGEDTRIFSDTYAAPLRIYVGDALVYDSEAGITAGMVELLENRLKGSRSVPPTGQVALYFDALLAVTRGEVLAIVATSRRKAEALLLALTYEP